MLTAYLGGRAQSPAERDELAQWRAYHALISAAEHHEKGNAEREREQLAFVERILAERPGALG